MIIQPDVTQVPLTVVKTGDKEMLTITHENGLTTVKVNSSSLSIMQTCQRKTKLALLDGYMGENDSLATVFGSAMHGGLEVFYAEPRENRNIPRNFVEQSDLMVHGHAAPEDHFLYRAIARFVEKAAPLRPLPDTDKHSISNGVWIFQEYIKTYINDPFEVYIDKDGPIIERRCEMEIYNDGKLRIILFGTIDVVLHNVRDNVILPTDHKTSGRVGSEFYNRLKPNHQYTAYALMAKEVLGIVGTGFLVNCIEKKVRPKTARGTGPHFPRQVTTRTEEDFAEFKQLLVYEVKRLLQGVDSGVWPLGSVDGCAMWNGCQFLEVCGAPPTIRQAMLDNKFKRKVQT